jgi:hypothetical protein
VSDRFKLDNVRALLLLAAAKTNDSSEEKHLTEFFNDVLSEGAYDSEDKLSIIYAAAEQMEEFCQLVKEAVHKDREG